MKRPSMLVTHPWMSRGGSEATAMWTLQALLDDYDLTFTTAAPLDDGEWEKLNRAYGTRVDPARLRYVKAPALPGVNGPLRLAHLQVRRFERFCHGLAPSFDLCLSAYNPVWFGRPAIQLLGDFSFSEEMRCRLNARTDAPLRHRATPLRRLYLKVGDWIEVDQPPLCERGDLLLANSAWAARQLEEHFRVGTPGILHPPVPLPTASWDEVQAADLRDPLSFVCLGRVVPEKEIERMVSILARVRELGFPVTFTIVGDFGQSDYGREVARHIERQGDWIATPGFLTMEEKRRTLRSHTFALHACRIEAFGIAVAEMAAMGCVPFVPSSGGAGEIVPFPELQFESDDEAVAKITALLRDPARVRELSGLLPGQVERFAPDRFVERLRDYVQDFLLAPVGPAHEIVPENLPAAL